MLPETAELERLMVCKDMQRENFLSLQAMMRTSSGVEAELVQMYDYGEIRVPSSCQHMTFEKGQYLKTAKIHSVSNEIVAVSFTSSNNELLKVGWAPTEARITTYAFSSTERFLGFKGASSESLSKTDKFKFDSLALFTYTQNCTVPPIAEIPVLPQEPLGEAKKDVYPWVYTVVAFLIYLTVGIIAMLIIVSVKSVADSNKPLAKKQEPVMIIMAAPEDEEDEEKSPLKIESFANTSRMPLADYVGSVLEIEPQSAATPSIA